VRLRVMSDLHNEFGQVELPDVACDAVILAGDTDVGSRGAQWAIERFVDTPIFYVAGNHEYFGKKLPKLNGEIDALCAATNLHFLRDGEAVLGDVRFLGCTLWTDFRIHGAERQQVAAYSAQNDMTDYRRIRLGSTDRYRKLKPADTVRFHHHSVQYLEQRLQERSPGPTVVVTHHAPSRQSLIAGDELPLLDAAYGSDLEWLIQRHQPALWIHGHVHERRDYMLGATRVVCNPRGYSGTGEVEGFAADLVAEV
jgi:calcineurin-like phosphoesterase family protein